MTDEEEKKIAADLARVMALMCVRNTQLEDIHAGKHPVTKTGDYSDVVVIDAAGREISWPDVSHISDLQMRDLMKQVVNRLYTFMLKADDPRFQGWIDRWSGIARRWDDPELDASFRRSCVRSSRSIRTTLPRKGDCRPSNADCVIPADVVDAFDASHDEYLTDFSTLSPTCRIFCGNG